MTIKQYKNPLTDIQKDEFLLFEKAVQMGFSRLEKKGVVEYDYTFWFDTYQELIGYIHQNHKTEKLPFGPTYAQTAKTMIYNKRVELFEK